MKRINFTLLIAILITVNAFGQNIDSLEICDLKIAINQQQKLNDLEELALDYNLKLIRYFDNKGLIKKESFWLIETVPVFETRFYNTKGEISRIDKVLESCYDLCFALKIANESGLLSHENFYISIFDDKHPSDYKNHWFVGYEVFDGDYWFETVGKVINRKTGQIDNFHTITHDQPIVEQSLDDELIMYMDEPPTFPGGIDSLKIYLQSSISLKSDSIVSGKVFIQFKIDTLGQVKDCRLLRGINDYQNKEALRIVENMPKWKPAKQGSDFIETPFVIPVIFRNDE